MVCAESKLKDSGLVARGKLLQGSHLILTAGSQGQLSAEGAHSQCCVKLSLYPAAGSCS